MGPGRNICIVSYGTKTTKAVVKVLKGLRNYQTNLVRTKQFFLLVLLTNYREYLTSPGKHLLWLWLESKLDMPFKSDYNLKWRWCFPIEPQLYKTGKIWTCSPTALELEATYGGLLKALSNEYILRYLIFI